MLISTKMPFIRKKGSALKDTTLLLQIFRLNIKLRVVKTISIMVRSDTRCESMSVHLRSLPSLLFLCFT
jgi:hypothetical protein